MDLLDPGVYKDISESDLRYVFRSVNGSVPIPLFEERLRLLHDAGATLLDRFDGKFLNVLRLADHSSAKLLELLCEHFPSFCDTATFHGQEGEQ